MMGLESAIRSNAWVYNGLFVLLIIFFAYFYTSLTFRPDDVADNIKKQGGYIPGIRPGKQTAEYIERTLNRLTFGGGVYLATILRDSVGDGVADERALLLRWNGPAHCRRCRARHGSAD